MSEVWERSGPVPISGQMRLLLESKRGVSFADASALRLLAQSGQAETRSVTYFRIFDPSSVGEEDRDNISYDDLGTDLILYSGHIERDGTVTLI